MAPTPPVRKAAPKVQRSVTKTTASKGRSSPATAVKKAIVNKKPTEKIPLKMNNPAVDIIRQRTRTAPIATPKPKENKPKENNPVTPHPRSTRKPLWKRPAHSGVPVPEKMKQLFKKQLQDLNDSL